MALDADADPVHVSLLALPESTPAALYGLYEVFSAVGTAWTELTGEPAVGPRMQTRIVAPSQKPFASPIGLQITPHASLHDEAPAGLVVVADVTLSVDADPRGRWPEAAAWLRERFEGGATICSVCTGSVVLAEAGLLNGYEATSHWGVASLFSRCYPSVKLRAERILVPAGPEHRLVTGGGSSAWEDVAVYLIARFCGEVEAVRVAKIFLLGDRSEGQLPYAGRPRPLRHDDAVIARCQAWIADHYAGDNPVARMAAQSGLSERTFARRFKAATGYSPVDYVQTLRIEEAKQLLETTGEPTDAIAHQIGYDDPAFFRRLFKRRTGTTPARYCQRFRSIATLHRRA